MILDMCGPTAFGCNYEKFSVSLSIIRVPSPDPTADPTPGVSLLFVFLTTSLSVPKMILDMCGPTAFGCNYEKFSVSLSIIRVPSPDPTADPTPGVFSGHFRHAAVAHILLIAPRG